MYASLQKKQADKKTSPTHIKKQENDTMCNSNYQFYNYQPENQTKKTIQLQSEQETKIQETMLKSNNTGIPTQIKTEFEKKSGFSFDDVRVHYNSDKPVQLQSYAYTQGNQIYIGSGHEKYLKHELGHVIQQKQQRVNSTLRLNNIKINDNPILEREADRYADTSSPSAFPNSLLSFTSSYPQNVIQRVVNIQKKYIVTKDVIHDKFFEHFTKSKKPIEKNVNQDKPKKKSRKKSNTYDKKPPVFDLEKHCMWEYNLKLTYTDYERILSQLIDDTALHQFNDYKQLGTAICLIYYNEERAKQPTTSNPTISSLSALSFELFTPDKLNAHDDVVKTFTKLDMETIYRASSPTFEKEPSWFPFRNKDLSFTTKASKDEYHVNFAGRFLRGVGTYEQLLTSSTVVPELSNLFKGTLDKSGITTVNELYTLIVAVEGCARSTHNIALASIFFQNYNTIKDMYADKKLFDIAEIFLTFVRKGGASASKKCDNSNIDEIKMLLAHCEQNNIPLEVEEIKEHLKELTESIIQNANINITAGNQ